MTNEEHYAIKLRKFRRVCPITGRNEESIKVGSPVIIQTDRGIEFGEIVKYTRGLPRVLARDVKLKKVIRYTTNEDLEKVKILPEKEAAALQTAQQKVKELGLPIRIVEVEYLFDASRALFYYRVQEGKRVKYLRDLSRDLFSLLKIRADLRQVSSRDEVRLFGGVGPCGRMICCSVWLQRPKQVTVKMIKEQGISIMPTKTTGLCGKFMCCLSYEK